MTVAAPSDVQPSEPTADASNGVPVRTASAVWILIAGVVGLAAALTLTIEKIEILINPDYVPSCSINPVLSCGSVMVTPQASAFGFPNPLIGIVSFTIVGVTGVLALAKIKETVGNVPGLDGAAPPAPAPTPAAAPQTPTP